MNEVINLAIKRSIEEAKFCSPVQTAYNVGCVITDLNYNILTTGFSRELEGNTHAEENAITKLLKIPNINTSKCILFSTMEPCSKRLSCKKTCCERIIESGIKIVYMGVKEPDNFVNCEGAKILKEKGVDLRYYDDCYREQIQVLNSHLAN